MPVCYSLSGGDPTVSSDSKSATAGDVYRWQKRVFEGDVDVICGRL